MASLFPIIGKDSKCWEFGRYHDKIVEIPGLPEIVKCMTGLGTPMMIDVKGNVWQFKRERNVDNLGNRILGLVPKKIKGIKDIVNGAPGFAVKILVNSHGSMFFHNGKKKIRIKDLPKIISVAAGISFYLALDENNNVWKLDSDYKGKLSYKILQGLQLITSISCGEKHAVIIDLYGSVFYFENKPFETSNEIIKLENLPIIVLGVCGRCHTILLDNEGFIWVFGSNEYGQLGMGNTEDRTDTPIKNPYVKDIVDIYCLETCTLVINCLGECFHFGEFFNDFTEPVYFPKKVPDFIAYVKPSFEIKSARKTV